MSVLASAGSSVVVGNGGSVLAGVVVGRFVVAGVTGTAVVATTVGRTVAVPASDGNQR